MECKIIESYVENDKREIVYKIKKSFDTLDEAIDIAKLINSKDQTIINVVAYKCSKCFKYHIGRNGRN